MLVKTLLNRVHPVKGFVYESVKLIEGAGKGDQRFRNTDFQAAVIGRPGKKGHINLQRVPEVSTERGTGTRPTRRSAPGSSGSDPTGVPR
jgi:hypothetical protein